MLHIRKGYTGQPKTRDEVRHDFFAAIGIFVLFLVAPVWGIYEDRAINSGHIAALIISLIGLIAAIYFYRHYRERFG